MLHVATAAPNLGLLLDAHSVVIIGASADFTRLGGIPVKRLLDAGFPSDRLLLVNPKYEEIAGLVCHSTIASLPWTPDLAVLAISAEQTLRALEECHARGIRAATLFASGFGEEASAEARARQDALVAFARRTRMIVAGPNCLGHASFRTRMFPTFLKIVDRQIEPGPFAIVSQSGNVASQIRLGGIEVGLRFSYAVSTGNEACVDLTDYLEHFLADNGTRAVLCYVEQVRNGPRFLELATRMRKAGKAIFMLRAGNSEKGAQAVASHTGAMGGSRAAYDAAFAQVGIGTATDPSRLIDLATLWSTGKRLASSRACIVSLSGATGALLADHFSDAGIELPSLSLATQQGLRRVVPSFGAVANPVDLTGQAQNDSASSDVALELIGADESCDVAVFYVVSGLLDKMATALIRMAQTTGKLVIVLDPSHDSTSHPQLRAGGVPVFTDMNRLSAALASFIAWCRLQHETWLPRTSAGERLPPPEEFRRARAAERHLLDEVESKDFLRRMGLPMVPETLARNAFEACAAAGAFGGPVALKIVSPDIPHKSDIGAVRLNLRDAAAVEAAFGEIVANAAAARPGARIEGVVVQPMVPSGQQLLVGVVRDQVFGYIMTVGFGGILTELLADVSRRVLPVSAVDALAMLQKLRGFPLLEGFRGTAQSDIQALARAIASLSDIVVRHEDHIEELELNPVIVSEDGQGVCAVDALIRIS